MPVIGSSIARAWAVPSTITTFSANGAQYDGETVLTITGTNFTEESEVTLDGVVYDTTYVSAAQIQITIPSALDADSPLRVADDYDVTVNTGGASTWTVEAWEEGDEADCSGLWIPSTTNCDGATGYLQRFTDFTDLTGTADLVGGSGTEPGFVPANHNAIAWPANDSVYTGLGYYAQRTTQTIDGAEYFIVIALNHLTFDGNNRTILSWDGGNRKLWAPAGAGRIDWVDTPNTIGASATVSTGTLTAEDNYAVYSIWREADDTVHMQSNDDAEFTPGGTNDSTGNGGTMTLGPPSGAGETFTAYVSTWSADPGETIRIRARNKAMIMTGLA